MNICQISAEQTIPVRHKVLWPDHPAAFCRVADDDLGIHFGANLAGQLVCVASIFITAHEARLRKFATLPEHQGKGIGSAMLQHILEYLHQRGVRYFWCDARESAQSLYQRFGMQAEGTRFFKQEVPFIRMGRKLQPN